MNTRNKEIKTTVVWGKMERSQITETHSLWNPGERNITFLKRDKRITWRRKWYLKQAMIFNKGGMELEGSTDVI